MKDLERHVDKNIIEALRIVKTACSDSSMHCTDCPFYDPMARPSCLVGHPYGWSMDEPCDYESMYGVKGGFDGKIH